LIDLSSNESPYGRSCEELMDLCRGLEDLNRYLAYGELERLERELAEYCGVDKERIFVGSGTDNLIRNALLKFYKGMDLIVLNPCGNRVVETAKDLGMRIRRIQLRPPEFRVDWKSLEIKKSIVAIDYPNNPTGQLLIEKNELECLLKNGNIVIIDEAGYEYSKRTFAGMVGAYEKLAVTRTLDKAFGLAGLRVGYMVAGDFFVKVIGKTVDINRPAFVCAMEALRDERHMRESVSKTLEEREYLEYRLRELGFDVYKSQANYLCVRSEIADLALRLREKGILVEDLSREWFDGYFRISIGGRDENSRLLEEIELMCG